jgi:hypothetical protein
VGDFFGAVLARERDVSKLVIIRTAPFDTPAPSSWPRDARNQEADLPRTWSSDPAPRDPPPATGSRNVIAGSDRQIFAVDELGTVRGGASALAKPDRQTPST